MEAHPSHTADERQQLLPAGKIQKTLTRGEIGRIQKAYSFCFYLRVQVIDFLLNVNHAVVFEYFQIAQHKSKSV